MSDGHRFELTWKALPADLFTSQNKGSKMEARKEWDKLKIDDDVYKQITEYLKAKEEVDRQRKQGPGLVPAWPHFCRMLKRQFWLDDLPVVKHKRAAPTGKCDCGGPIDHSATRLCWRCYGEKFGNTLAGWQ